MPGFVTHAADEYNVSHARMSYDPELIAAAQRVHNGTASRADLLRCRLQNRELNEMAATGFKGPDGKPAVPRESVFQSVQRDYQDNVIGAARSSAQRLGTDVRRQTVDPSKMIEPMTDSDLISDATTPEQVAGIRQGIQEHFQGMERELADLDRAAGRQPTRMRSGDFLDSNEIDVFVDAQTARPQVYNEVAGMNKEPYKNQQAGVEEALSRGDQSLDPNRHRGDLTGTSAITDEMREKIDKKGRRTQQILDAVQQNPDIKGSDKVAADLVEAGAHGAKYQGRLDAANRAMADHYGVAGPSEELSDLVTGDGKLRRGDTLGGRTAPAIVDANRQNYLDRGLINQSEILGRVANTGQESMEALTEQVVRNADGLSPAAQGELLDRVARENPELAGRAAAALRGEAYVPPKGRMGDVGHQFGDDAKWTRLDDKAVPDGPNVGGAVAAGVMAGIEFGEASARHLGDKLDKGEDISVLSDAAAVTYDALGGTALEALHDAGMSRLVEERQSMIEARPDGQLTLQDHVDSVLLTMGAGVEGMGQAAYDGLRDIVERNLREMQAEAEAEGRPVNFLDTVEMQAQALSEMAGAVTPLGTLARWEAEMGTYDERADWAGQKDAMLTFLDGKATLSDKTSQNLQNELERIIYNGDPNDPATAQRVNEILSEIQNQQDTMSALGEFADRNLGEIDPDKLSTFEGRVRSQVDVDSLRDYADQMLQERGAGPLPEPVKEDLSLEELRDRALDPTLGPIDRMRARREFQEELARQRAIQEAIQKAREEAEKGQTGEPEGETPGGTGDMAGEDDVSPEDEAGTEEGENLGDWIGWASDDVRRTDERLDDLQRALDEGRIQPPDGTTPDQLRDLMERAANDPSALDELEVMVQRAGPRPDGHFPDTFVSDAAGELGGILFEPDNFADDFASVPRSDTEAWEDDGYRETGEADIPWTDDGFRDIDWDVWDGVGYTGNGVGDNIDFASRIRATQAAADTADNAERNGAHVRNGGGIQLASTRPTYVDTTAADAFTDGVSEPLNEGLTRAGNSAGSAAAGQAMEGITNAREEARERSEREAARQAEEEQARREAENRRRRSSDSDDDSSDSDSDSYDSDDHGGGGGSGIATSRPRPPRPGVRTPTRSRPSPVGGGRRGGRRGGGGSRGGGGCA